MEFKPNKGKENAKIDQKCRLCLGDESLENVMHGGTLHKRMLELLGIRVSGKNGFVCAVCRTRVNEFYCFRKRCREIQDALMRNKNVKPPNLDGNWPCDQCPKVFSTKAKRKDHVRYHRPKDYKCDVCGKAFARPSLLAAHVRIHAEDYPKRQSRTKIKSKKNADALPQVKIEPQAENDILSETWTQSEKQNPSDEAGIGIRLEGTSEYHIPQNFVKLEPVDDPMETHGVRTDSESFIFEDMIDIQQVKVEMPSEIPNIETFAKSSKACRTKRKTPTEEGPIKCDLCAKGFWLRIKLHIHKKRIHGTEHN